MYNNVKFWIFATCCFLLSTLFYFISYGLISFMSILNAIIFIVCVINLIIIKNKGSVSNKKSKKKK